MPVFKILLKMNVDIHKLQLCKISQSFSEIFLFISVFEKRLDDVFVR